jgi:hypothetical protein
LPMHNPIIPGPTGWTQARDCRYFNLTGTFNLLK